MYRLLRALASVGVFREDADRRFALTALGDCLRSDAPESLAPWAAHIGEAGLWQAWGTLLDSVRTGENAFRRVHGVDTWEYYARNRKAGALFDRAMTGHSRMQANAVLNAYDFARFQYIVDVGGGHGTLLSAILAQHQSLHGALFDQPHVAAGAEAVLRTAGVAGRCQVLGGNFFEAVPGGADAYVLKFILHDWEDEQAIPILRSCRRAIVPHGKLLIIDSEIAAPNEGAVNKFRDLTMLVHPGGRERTRGEWTALLAAGGFRLAAVIPTEAWLSIIEGVPT